MAPSNSQQGSSSSTVASLRERFQGSIFGGGGNSHAASNHQSNGGGGAGSSSGLGSGSAGAGAGAGGMLGNQNANSSSSSLRQQFQAQGPQNNNNNMGGQHLPPGASAPINSASGSTSGNQPSLPPAGPGSGPAGGSGPAYHSQPASVSSTPLSQSPALVGNTQLPRMPPGIGSNTIPSNRFSQMPPGAVGGGVPPPGSGSLSGRGTPATGIGGGGSPAGTPGLSGQPSSGAGDRGSGGGGAGGRRPSDMRASVMAAPGQGVPFLMRRQESQGSQGGGASPALIGGQIGQPPGIGGGGMPLQNPLAGYQYPPPENMVMNPSTLPTASRPAPQPPVMMVAPGQGSQAQPSQSSSQPPPQRAARTSSAGIGTTYSNYTTPNSIPTALPSLHEGTILPPGAPGGLSQSGPIPRNQSSGNLSTHSTGGQSFRSNEGVGGPSSSSTHSSTATGQPTTATRGGRSGSVTQGLGADPRQSRMLRNGSSSTSIPTENTVTPSNLTNVSVLGGVREDLGSTTSGGGPPPATGTRSGRSTSVSMQQEGSSGSVGATAGAGGRKASSANVASGTSLADLTACVRRTKGDIPPPLVGSSMSVVGSTLYLFGGRLVPTRTMIANLWSLDLHALVWKQLWPRPVKTRSPPKKDGKLVKGKGKGKDKEASFMMDSESEQSSQDEEESEREEGEARRGSTAQDSTDEDEQGPQPRYFHSAEPWGTGRILFFGGMGYSPSPPNNSDQQNPQQTSGGGLCVLNDVVIWHINEQRWSFPDTSADEGVDMPSPRYAHLSVINNMLVPNSLYSDGSPRPDNASLRRSSQDRSKLTEGGDRERPRSGISEQHQSSSHLGIADPPPSPTASSFKKGARPLSSRRASLAPTTAGASVLSTASSIPTSTLVHCLVVFGGQDISNRYVHEINVLDLTRMKWVQSRRWDRHCGTYRSVAVCAPLSVKAPPPLEGAPMTGGGLGRERSETVTTEDSRSLAPGGRDRGLSVSSAGTRPSSPSSAQGSSHSGAPTTNDQDSSTGKKKHSKLTSLTYSCLPNYQDPEPIYLYSNFNFSDVRRDLEVISAPRRPDFDLGITQLSDRMVGGPSLPPGLRFPTGGMIGRHMIISGTFLSHQLNCFAIWALDLGKGRHGLKLNANGEPEQPQSASSAGGVGKNNPNQRLVWQKIEPGTVLQKGSWNRGITWRNSVVVLGDRERDIAADYDHRQTNFVHVAFVDLEVFGIYQPPPQPLPSPAQRIGLFTLSLPALSDFEILCSDGKRLGCNRLLLEQRWGWFAGRMADFRQKARGIGVAQQQRRGTDAGINDDAQTIDTNNSAATATAASTSTILGPGTLIGTDWRLAPRCLHLPEPSSVVLALLQYFYTYSLSTPLQLSIPTLSSLLLLSRIYDEPNLRSLVIHALHLTLGSSESHDDAAVYEASTLGNCMALQIRALKLIINSHHKGNTRRLAGTTSDRVWRRTAGDSINHSTAGSSADNDDEDEDFETSSLSGLTTIDEASKTAESLSLSIPRPAFNFSPGLVFLGREIKGRPAKEAKKHHLGVDGGGATSSPISRNENFSTSLAGEREQRPSLSTTSPTTNRRASSLRNPQTLDQSSSYPLRSIPKLIGLGIGIDNSSMATIVSTTPTTMDSGSRQEGSLTPIVPESSSSIDDPVNGSRTLPARPAPVTRTSNPNPNPLPPLMINPQPPLSSSHRPNGSVDFDWGAGPYHQQQHQLTSPSGSHPSLHGAMRPPRSRKLPSPPIASSPTARSIKSFPSRPTSSSSAGERNSSSENTDRTERGSSMSRRSIPRLESFSQWFAGDDLVIEGPAPPPYIEHAPSQPHTLPSPPQSQQASSSSSPSLTNQRPPALSTSAPTPTPFTPSPHPSNFIPVPGGSGMGGGSITGRPVSSSAIPGPSSQGSSALNPGGDEIQGNVGPPPQSAPSMSTQFPHIIPSTTAGSGILPSRNPQQQLQQRHGLSLPPHLLYQQQQQQQQQQQPPISSRASSNPNTQQYQPSPFSPGDGSAPMSPSRGLGLHQAPPPATTQSMLYAQGQGQSSSGGGGGGNAAAAYFPSSSSSSSSSTAGDLQPPSPRRIEHRVFVDGGTVYDDQVPMRMSFDSSVVPGGDAVGLGGAGTGSVAGTNGYDDFGGSDINPSNISRQASVLSSSGGNASDSQTELPSPPQSAPPWVLSPGRASISESSFATPSSEERHLVQTPSLIGSGVGAVPPTPPHPSTSKKGGLFNSFRNRSGSSGGSGGADDKTVKSDRSSTKSLSLRKGKAGTYSSYRGNEEEEAFKEALKADKARARAVEREEKERKREERERQKEEKNQQKEADAAAKKARRLTWTD